MAASTIIKCGTCRHWFKPVDSPRYGICSGIPYGGTCYRAPESFAGQDSKVQVCDGEGYGTTVWTLPDFGCVLHEESP